MIHLKFSLNIANIQQRKHDETTNFPAKGKYIPYSLLKIEMFIAEGLAPVLPATITPCWK
jgi:hypothetical protein